MKLAKKETPRHPAETPGTEEITKGTPAGGQTAEITGEAPAGGQAAERNGSSDSIMKEFAAVQAQLEEQRDQLLRTAAEFDNYKKRTERERVAVGEFARAQTLKALLPILDNMGRALSADPSSPEYVKGVEMIVKQFQDALSCLGLAEISAEGERFDPQLHEAVMHIEDASAGENTVVEVLQKGYKIGDTVIRPAMVKVAN